MINSLVNEGHSRLYFNPDFSFLRHRRIHDPAGAGISQRLVQCPQITERFWDGAVENNFPFFGGCLRLSLSEERDTTAS